MDSDRGAETHLQLVDVYTVVVLVCHFEVDESQVAHTAQPIPARRTYYIYIYIYIYRERERERETARRHWNTATHTKTQ